MTSTEEACIRPVLERIGIPLERRDGSNEAWFGWNGKALNLNVKPTNAIHEAAHWLVSQPERRNRMGFGLLRGEFKRWGPFTTPDEEEIAASLLGILMERHLALDWRHTYEDHNWCESHVVEHRPWVRTLQQLGHLRGLTPTCFLESQPPEVTP